MEDSCRVGSRDVRNKEISSSPVSVPALIINEDVALGLEIEYDSGRGASGDRGGSAGKEILGDFR